MDLKSGLLNSLEWANKRLQIMGKGLDDEQLEIIEFYTLKNKQQFSLKGIDQFDELYYNFIIWYNAKPVITKDKKIHTRILLRNI